MAKKIQYKDLAEEQLFQPAIDSAEKLLIVLDKLEKQFKDLLKESKNLSEQKPLTGYENIQATEQAAKKMKTAVEGLDKIERERLKLQQKLKDLEAGRLTDSIKLRQEINTRTRTLRQAAKESSAASTAYERESARLVRLRREYKDLAIQNKGNTKEAKALLKEITKLDRKLKDLDESVGQNQRSVGNYRIAVDRLRGSFKLLAGSAVVAALAQIVQLFNQNSEGSARLQKAIGRITVTLSVLVGRFVKAIPAIQSLFTQLGQGIRKTFLEIKIAIAELPAILGGSEAKAKDLTKQLAALNAEAAKETASLDSLAEAFAGVGDEIDSLIDTNDTLIDRTLSYQKQINALNKETEQLRVQQRLLQVASDDNTTSLKSQRQATEELIKANAAITRNEIEVSRKRLELAKLNATVNKNSIEAQTELAEAVIALEQAKAESLTANAEGNRRLREIERDDIELDLDQLIDIADRRKTINEQIAADERQSLDTRRAALDEINTDIEASFRKQAEVIQQGTKVAFDIDDLISETDTVKLNERIKALGLDEIRQNRLREIIQERIQSTQDLAVAQDDLNDTEKEAAEIQSDILLQEEALQQIRESGVSINKVIDQLAKNRLQNEIDNLRVRIELAKAELKNKDETSTELLELNQQLNDKLLEQDTARIQKQAEQQKQLTELTFGFIQRFSEKQSQARIDAIDKEIEAASQRTDQLRELAAQGVENAEDNIALEERKRAELEAKREAAVKRQARQQLLLSSIETFNAKVQAGEPNPLAATVVEIAALEAFINSLPGFYEGSEMIASDLSPTIDGKDGYIVRVDGSERVLTGQQNAMIGQMSNMELATLAADHNSGRSGNHEVVKELQRLASIVDSKPVYLGRDYDATRKAIIDTVAKKGKIERVHRKGNSIF